MVVKWIAWGFDKQTSYGDNASEAATLSDRQRFFAVQIGRRGARLMLLRDANDLVL
ncbi:MULTISPECIES: hypothetical protein [Gluconobacter]|uniref:hypothetical protein n=1 Tax=Gluconobacter TaxID=441 RepID=UPI000A909EE3|nr:MULTISPECIES: hypothetical protein [Gluconobacter]